MPKSGLTAALEQDCISEDAILDLLAGDVRGEKLIAIERHLAGCATCRRVIAVAGAHIRSIGRHDSRARSTASNTEASLLLRSLRTIDEVDYVVERELARGGMGRVLLATDRQGRSVALKVLLGSGERATRRFLREMQITARLQHPSIITLYEAGRWRSGEPFFAMKLVQGRSLRDELAACTALKDRLSLVPRLIAVTDALAYAHDQGVIHRDLKPGNILVGAFGETVVIDWGLAKAGDLPCTETSEPGEPSGVVSAALHGDHTTELGTPVGTPAYMAPEQARGDALDERTDVYGLGALLYHVLSGRAPYSGISPRDVLARVLGGPPPSLAERLPELPSDLIAIVEKAMMPEPADRYATAQSMAEDLRRFSAGQLVSVHAYSARALVWRWGRKNRAAVSVAAFLLAVGVVAAWLSVNRIIQERNRAEAERVIATTHHTAAESLVNFLMTEFRDRVSRADRLDLVDGLGDRIVEYYRNVDQSGAPPNNDTLINRAITVQGLAGLEIDRRNTSAARDLYQRALEFWKLADRGGATATADLERYGKAWRLHGLVEHLAGNTEAALESYGRAIELANRMIASDPENLAGHLLRAWSLESTCETLQFPKGDLEGSFRACQLGIAQLEPLLAEHPKEPDLLLRLAILNQMTSDRHLALGHLDEAAACIERSGTLHLRVLEATPTDLRAARAYAYTFVYASVVDIARGHLQAALAAIDTNVQRYEAIVHRDSQNRAIQQDLGVGYAYKCDFERRASRLEAAEAACRRAVTLIRGPQQAETPAYTTSLLVLAQTNLGRVELAAHRVPSALVTLGEAVAASRGLVQSDPGSGKWKEDLLGALTWLVDAELQLGRIDEAATHSREALALAEGMARDAPASSDIQSSLGRIQTFAGSAALAQRRSDEAVTLYESARGTFEGLVQRSPQMVDFQTGLARASAHLARALDATTGAKRGEALRLRAVAGGILDGLHQTGRLYPEDRALRAVIDARAVRMPTRVDRMAIQ